jgi:glycosyltransferase involved in cell wall biosynthesis
MRDASKFPEYDVVILGARNYRIGRFQNGGGYRYMELALSLIENGLRAAVIAPEPSDFKEPPIPVIDQSTMSYLDISKRAPAFIFCLLEDVQLVDLLSQKKKLLIYDSYLSPVEQLTYEEVVCLGDDALRDEHFQRAVDKHNHFNEIADHFIVGEPEEKLLKFGELINTHRVTVFNQAELAHRIHPLPVMAYSHHSQPPEDLSPRNSTFLWNGGLWNHYAGMDLIFDAVDTARHRGVDLDFWFLYPRATIKAHSVIVDRIARSGTSSVRYGLADHQAPDYFEKQEILAQCRGLVLLYEPVLQVNLFPSMRLREALLYEKPIIASRDGVTGRLIDEHGIGISVENTEHCLADAMIRLATDGDFYDQLVDNIRRFKQRYAMERFVSPIAEVIKTKITLPSPVRP